MRRILTLWIALAGLLAVSPAGSGSMTLLGVGKVGGAIAYTGPGDIVAFTWWGGFRAYSAATAGTKAVRIVRASDSTQTDINTLANGSFDAASATAFCASTTCKVVTVYDKVSTNDVTQATDGNRPALTANALGTSYCMTTTGSGTMGLNSSATFSSSQPYSFVHISNQTTTTPDQGVFSLMNAGFTDGATFNFTAGGVTATLYAGANGNATITSSTAWRAYQAIANGASSIITVDGADSTVSSGAQAITAETIAWGHNTGGQGFIGVSCEAGYVAAAISGPNRTALNTNMHAAYGGF
jgi:hypothetical protein